MSLKYKDSFLFALCLLAYSLSSTHTYAQDEYKNLKSENLFGPVKTLRESSLYAENKEEYSSLFMSFDQQGYMIESTWHDRLMTDFTQKYQYKYNDKGKCTMVHYQNIEPGYDKDNTTYYKYDDKGNLSECIIHYSDHQGMPEYKEKYTYTYAYNKDGQITESCTYKSECIIHYSDHQGMPEYKEKCTYTYAYNKDGQITESCTYRYDKSSPDGYMEEKTVYEYDKKTGKLSESKNTEYNTMRKKIYDENGNIIENLFLDYNDNEEITYSSKTTYKYNKNGYLTEECEYDENGKLKEKNTYQYDKYGNEIDHHRMPSYGDKHNTKTYKYDKQNNWIECIVKFGDEESDFIYRTIEYYE